MALPSIQTVPSCRWKPGRARSIVPATAPTANSAPAAATQPSQRLATDRDRNLAASRAGFARQAASACMAAVTRAMNAESGISGR